MHHLIVFAFPLPCCAVFSGSALIYFACCQEKNNHAEQALPQLFQACQKEFVEKKCLLTITTIATFKEPGPFTALRAGLAFAYGIQIGFSSLDHKEIRIKTPSFFEVLKNIPLDKPFAIHTGIQQWITEDSAINTLDHTRWEEISVAAYTAPKAQQLAEYLNAWLIESSESKVV